MKSFVVACLAASALSGCGLLRSVVGDPAGGGAHTVVADAPDWQVCYMAVSPRTPTSVREYANNVIRTRPVDCNQHMQMVMARLQAEGASQANANARTQLGLDMMRAAQPRPAPMPAPITCRSVNMGTYVRTVCD